jgi:RNA polymerase sigma-70 factor (ECF subfamily)
MRRKGLLPRDAALDEIERVYRARFAEYHRVATAVLRDPDAARDAVQEAFAAAVRKRTSFRGDGPLEAWLWRVVVNMSLNQLRQTPMPDLPAEPTHENETRDDDVRSALAELSERQRITLFLRYYADLDYRTIASVLDVTEGTVGATLNAAHVKLRRRFEEVAT